MMHLTPLLLTVLTPFSPAGDLCFEDQGDLHGLSPLGGGIAVIDFDNDGFQDLVIGNGFAAGDLRLYRNVPGTGGTRTFQDVSTGSGLVDSDTALRDTSGIVVADIDGDGLDDIFASGYRAQPRSSGLLYRNLGGGVFANESISRGARATGFRMDSCSFVDYDHDGDVDIFGLCRSNPDNYLLLENDGTGQFTNNAAPLPNVQYFFRAYSHLWSDLDGDGWEDCVVLVDGSAADLLMNEPAPGGGRMLVESAASYGFTGLGTFPMGVASGDFDNDGDFDLAISNANDGKYFRNDGAGVLTAITPITSVWGWGVTWFDAENDGDLDLYMACSYPSPASDRLFESVNAGASFIDRTSVLGLDSSMASRYSVGIDIENDGFLDFVTVNPNQSGVLRPSIHKNLSTSTHDWIGLDLVGSGATNINALGAKVRVRAAGNDSWREVRSGSSTTSSEDPRLLVGLGAQVSTIEEVQVDWPELGNSPSRSELFGPFASKAYYTITRGSGSPLSPGTSFCTGTGICTLCPCSNDAPTGSPGGCINSNGGSGELVATGAASVAGDTLRFELRNATSQTFAILSSGDMRAPANASNPCFGMDTGIQSTAFDGLRCVVQNILRHGTRPTDTNGEVGTTTPGWGPPNGPTGGILAANAFAAGQTRAFQVIYRENPALGCGRGQNTSQGLEITFAP